MIQNIDVKKAKYSLEECGYIVEEIHAINEGSNHYVFDVVLEGNKPAICKFAKIRDTEVGISEDNKDTLFGGTLSLNREAYLFRMILEETGVATPEVYGFHDSTYGEFILVEKIYGMSHKECMKINGYSKQIFLDSMYHLGKDFADVQNVTFSSFGNIMEDSVIEPEGIKNFADRFKGIVKTRIDKCVVKKVFDSNEAKIVKDSLYKKLEEFAPSLSTEAAPPVLIFTDMHAENFFTDKDGVPTGYFDLESAQAAPAALEFYGFRFFLFNFYDDNCFQEAEKSFFKGYTEANGKYAPKTPEDSEFIDFLAACRLLELSESYWGYIDGIRDNWGEEMKALLFHYIDTNIVDYNSIGAIWRQRDEQPLTPLS